MKQKRFLGLLPAFALLALPVLVHGQSLSVGDAVAEFNETVSVGVTLQSDQDVQGVVVAAQWDAAVATGQSIDPSAAIDDGDDANEANADTVVTRIGDGFAVMGVVLDSDPTDNGGAQEVIPAGDAVEIASITLVAGPDEATSAIELVDGTLSAAEGGPTLDNVIVIGGLSVGEVEGLALNDGSISAIPTPDRLIIEETVIESPGGDVNILLNNNADVEGFVVAVCHDSAVVTLDNILVGADASQADFSAVEINESGGAMGVVIDLFDPMESPPNITPGSGSQIAVFQYLGSTTSDDALDAGLAFCDGAVGDPLKDNLIVVGGQSITQAEGLVLTANPVTLIKAQGPIPEREVGDDCTDGVDNDLDGAIDGDDLDCQSFDFEWNGNEAVAGTRGAAASVGLSYLSPAIGSGGADVLDGAPRVATQGFSLGFSYNCDEVAVNEEFDFSGTILETLNTEFARVQADNDGEDGDGCSFVLAVLVDALPPFDGAVIPGLADRQAMGSISIVVGDGVACGSEISIVPEDGVNGRGQVPVRNLISVDNFPLPTTVGPLTIAVVESPRFFRGDCNFTGRSLGLDPVEIADAAAIVSYLFLESIFKFDPPCLDACDANDDGRIDLADAIGVLNYLFISGSAFPPAPGPGFDADINQTGPGADPTEDPLDCVGGTACGI